MTKQNLPTIRQYELGKIEPLVLGMATVANRIEAVVDLLETYPDTVNGTGREAPTLSHEACIPKREITIKAFEITTTIPTPVLDSHRIHMTAQRKKLEFVARVEENK